MGAPSLKEYARILGRYRWAILTTVVVAIVTSTWLSQRLPPVYEATTTLYVPETLGKVAAAGESARVTGRLVPQPGIEKAALRGYFTILRSESVARMAAARVPGREAWQIRRNTQVSILSGSVFAVTARDREPAAAAAMANAVADAVNELLNLRSREPGQINRQVIEDEMERAQTGLAAAQEELRRFKEEHRTVSVSEEATQLVKQRATLAADLDGVRVRLREIRTKIADAKDRLGSERPLQLSESTVSENPTITELRTKLARLEVELAGAQAKFRELHPDVLRLRREIEEARRRLGSEVKTVLSSQTERLNVLHEHLRQVLVDSLIDQATLQAKQIGLEVVLRSLEEKIRNHPRVAIDLADRTRRVETLEVVLRKLALQLVEANIENRQVVNPFVIVDEARMPGAPAFPNVILSGVVAGLMGGVASVFYALFVSYLARPREPLVAELMRFSA